jgi:hypothetical protein
MKLILKILGIAVLVAVVGVIAFVIFIEVRGIPHYEARVPDVTIKSDSAMVANGGRLAKMLCKECHYNPATGKLSGAFMPDAGSFGKIWSRNITQDKDNGIGDWSDAQIMYLLRTGIKRNGDYAPPYMVKLVHMSDYDVKSIISWLHSSDPLVQPASNPDTVSQPNFLAKFLCFVAFKPVPYPTEVIKGPDTTNMVEYGKYIITGKIECWACHSKSFSAMNIENPVLTEGYMAGGNPIPDMHGNLITSANLTPDPETGIGNWTEDQFIKAVKYGIRPDGTTNRYPMAPFSIMTDYEAKCILAYLKTLKPVKNKIERTLSAN